MNNFYLPPKKLPRRVREEMFAQAKEEMDTVTGFLNSLPIDFINEVSFCDFCRKPGCWFIW